MWPYLLYFGASMFGTAQSQLPLNLTALTGRNSISVLECWQLTSPLTKKYGVDVFRMGDTESVSYYLVPPRYDAGRHPGPAKQYVWDGDTARADDSEIVTLPNATDEAIVHGGRYGLIYIDDTADVSVWGHRTTYPGYDDTILLMIPVRDSINPPHTVLYDGPCKVEELAGIGEWTP
ncbi:hypothetical protein Daesc_004430 [Daldinia eschscholtzii]|uniref:Uncharacterized protein n=1 Tax=Daldinia eschscholtzii TaxID=292717 RepID=A0AAX6MPU3_9PEZI